MKILITGSKGFLGRSVVRLINKKKNDLYFIVRRKKKVKKNFFCDLGNLKKIKYIVNFLKPDVIINLAAEINFITKTKKMHRVNSLAPKIFAQYCKKYNKHLIQASSTSVNGIHSLYNHKTKLNPVNAYGKTKLIGEKYIQKTQCNYSIIRFGGIYGRNGPSHLGINNFINQAISKKKLIFSGNSKSKRNYVFVQDAARSIINCMIRKKFGIFYMGGETQSFEAMIKKINLVLGSKKKILFKKKKELISDQIIKRDKIFKIKSFSESLKIIKCG
jgi:nucleoside-diphosphate-sugar epimerase